MNVTMKHGDNGMIVPGIARESLLLPVLVESAPNIGERIFFPSNSVLDQSIIRSIEIYDVNTFPFYYESLQYPVIRPADMPKFTFSLQIDDSFSVIEKMPLTSVDVVQLTGKKKSFCLDKITTAQSFVQRWDSAALVSALPFVIPFVFYYIDKNS